MNLVKRVGLLIVTNILVMVALSIALNLIVTFFGVNPATLGRLPFLLFVCAIFGTGGAFISLFLSKTMAKWMMGLQVIDPQSRNPHEREVLEMVYEMSRRAKLPKMPEVAIYNSPEVNAFATGPSRSNSLVAVSMGLLQNMRRNEVEGVIAHEVAHIANGDMITMTIVQGVVNTFVMFFARIVAGIISSAVDERYAFIVHLASVIGLQIVFGFLASPVVYAFSRYREFRADYGGAAIAGKDKMIAALRRLQNTSELIDTEETALASMKISNRSGWMAWFSTHPPLEQRIAALERARLM